MRFIFVYMIVEFWNAIKNTYKNARIINAQLEIIRNTSNSSEELNRFIFIKLRQMDCMGLINAGYRLMVWYDDEDNEWKSIPINHGMANNLQGEVNWWKHYAITTKKNAMLVLRGKNANSI